MKRFYMIIPVLVCVLMSSFLLEAGDTDLPQRYSGRIAAMGGPAAGQSAYLKFQVDRWAGKDELRRLDSILVHDGEKALLNAVAETDPAGWITVANGLRYYLRVITVSPLEDGGRVIRALTDRPIQFGEIARGSRSLDYGFGVIEIRFSPEGKGSGTLIPLARIHFRENSFEVENYQVASYRLIQVKQQKIKKK